MGPTLDYGCFLLMGAVSVLAGVAVAALVNRGFGLWAYPLGIAAAALTVWAAAWLISQFSRPRRH